ncbi:gamma-glutamyl-gamma-aminobutyrate hydrolase family protein [Melghirimyces algeriensis]|nr:gamma-glutamyl-gamma-aminobutyrate hydrolase family protein [Melghirimyces algeriensis]
MRPVIGITMSMRREENRLTLHRDNSDAIFLAGGLPFLLPYTTDKHCLHQMAKRMNGLLLTGGGDIDPGLFGEEPLLGLGEVEPERDRMEMALSQMMIEANKPVLALCRGFQILNIALGGDMYQDLYTQREGVIQHYQKATRDHASHTIQIAKDTTLRKVAGVDRIRVNSFHHQAVRRIPNGFIVSATAPDGVTEAFEKIGEPFVMGVQWHPENLYKKSAFARHLFQTFIDACKA